MNLQTKKPVHEIDDLPAETNRRSEASEARVIELLNRQRDAFGSRFLNRELRSQIRQALSMEFEQGFEHRQKALAMALETRLHAIREACNHVLVTGKTHLRQQRQEYFGEALRRVEQRMGELADDFLEEVDDRYQRIDRFQSEAIRERERQRLEKAADNFLTTLGRLMDEFTNIIYEHIDHTREGV